MQELDDQELWDLISSIEDNCLRTDSIPNRGTFNFLSGQWRDLAIRALLCLALTNRLCFAVFVRSTRHCIDRKTLLLAGYMVAPSCFAALQLKFVYRCFLVRCGYTHLSTTISRLGRKNGWHRIRNKLKPMCLHFATFLIFRHASIRLAAMTNHLKPQSICSVSQPSSFRVPVQRFVQPSTSVVRFRVLWWVQSLH